MRGCQACESWVTQGIHNGIHHRATSLTFITMVFHPEHVLSDILKSIDECLRLAIGFVCKNVLCHYFVIASTLLYIYRNQQREEFLPYIMRLVITIICNSVFIELHNYAIIT